MHVTAHRNLCLSDHFVAVGLSLALSTALIVTASSAAWSQSSETVDATKIVIGQSSGGGPAGIPLYIALDQGFFKRAGLDVTSQILSGATTAAAASFVNGSVNMLNSSAPELIEYTGKEDPLRKSLRRGHRPKLRYRQERDYENPGTSRARPLAFRRRMARTTSTSSQRCSITAFP